MKDEPQPPALIDGRVCYGGHKYHNPNTAEADYLRDWQRWARERMTEDAAALDAAKGRVAALESLLREYLADAPTDSPLDCTCDLCKRTRAALTEGS
jgi:predicted alpha/beta hydrolase